MRIAVTYQDGKVFPHFGHTEQFKLYEVENNQVIRSMVIPSTGFGHGALANFLKQAGVQLVICGGIGGGAIAALNAWQCSISWRESFRMWFRCAVIMRRDTVAETTGKTAAAVTMERMEVVENIVTK